MSLDFAAHLAAIASVPDPEDRAAARLLGAVVLDWTRLSVDPNPTFELDGSTLWLSGAAVPLPAPWREALGGLQGALRAHGVGGVRVSPPVDRASVLALLRGARALPPGAPREELQRWVVGHGGASVVLLGLRTPTARDPAAGLAAAYAAWTALDAACQRATRDRGPLPSALRQVVERAEADPRALATVACACGAGGRNRAPFVATVSVLMGTRLAIGRAAVHDLGAAAAATCLYPAADGSLRAWVLEGTDGRLGRRDARVLVSRAVPGPSDRVHLFARIVAAADDFAGLLGADLPPDAAVERLRAQAGRRHEAAIVDLLVGVVGRYPVGSVVVLDGGEIAAVSRAPAAPEQRDAPVVRVLVDRAGTPSATPPVLDLATGPRPRPRIVATADPRRLGLDPRAAAWG